MLSIPLADESASERLRAHSPKRAARRNIGRVKDGHTIGSLRATGGPPAGGRPAAAAPATPAAGVSLLDLPAGGGPLVASLQAPAREINPLLFALSRPEGDAASPPTKMRVLQQRINSLRHRFTQIDNKSRFLQASADPTHQNAWFRAMASSEEFDARG